MTLTSVATLVGVLAFLVALAFVIVGTAKDISWFLVPAILVGILGAAVCGLLLKAVNHSDARIVASHLNAKYGATPLERVPLNSGMREAALRFRDGRVMSCRVIGTLSNPTAICAGSEPPHVN